jgi:hypothetical protein
VTSVLISVRLLHFVEKESSWHAQVANFRASRIYPSFTQGAQHAGLCWPTDDGPSTTGWDLVDEAEEIISFAVGRNDEAPWELELKMPDGLCAFAMVAPSTVLMTPSRR